MLLFLYEREEIMLRLFSACFQLKSKREIDEEALDISVISA